MIKGIRNICKTFILKLFKYKKKTETKKEIITPLVSAKYKIINVK